MDLIWNGITIESRKPDNFINATQMCKACKKEFSHWYDTNTTKTLIRTLEEKLNSVPGISGASPIRAIDVKRGRSKKFTQGSWIHPHLAIQLAQWLNPKFAIAVSEWVFTLMTTGSVQLEEPVVVASGEEVALLKKKLLESEERAKAYEQQLKDKDGDIQRLNMLNRECLTYKKNRLKEESIYIVSSVAYAKLGIFKVGRTRKCMSVRSSQHNVSRIKGDKLKLLREFKVGNSVLMERIIHDKLRGLLYEDEKEWFHVPFKHLESVVQIIINHDHDDSIMVNALIDTIQDLRKKVFNSVEWTQGIPDEFFEEASKEEKEPTVVEIKDGEKVLASFDTRDMSPEQRKKFVQRCMDMYLEDNPQVAAATGVIWAIFQKLLIKQLQVPRTEFRALEWRRIAKSVAEDNAVPFVVKQSKALLAPE